jgi:hypothetical protein
VQNQIWPGYRSPLEARVLSGNFGGQNWFAEQNPSVKVLRPQKPNKMRNRKTKIQLLALVATLCGFRSQLWAQLLYRHDSTLNAVGNDNRGILAPYFDFATKDAYKGFV